MTGRVRLAAFVAAGLAVAAALALFVSPLASDEPDGLERVARDEGFADREANHALEDAPTAGYDVDGVDDDGLSTGLAGLLGVAVTFALAAGLFVLVRRLGARRPRAGSPEPDAPKSPPSPSPEPDAAEPDAPEPRPSPDLGSDVPEPRPSPDLGSDVPEAPPSPDPGSEGSDSAGPESPVRA